MRFQTRAIHVGVEKDSSYNSVTTPIYQTSTFQFTDVGKTKGFDYTRTANPTRSALEENLASLEGGAGAVATATGMAAMTTVLHLLPAGSHVVCTHDCYGGTDRLFRTYKEEGKLDVTYVDMQDLKAVEGAFRPTTKAVWIETPSNPLLAVVDIAALSEMAHAHSCLSIVDNTFLSPASQRPLELGADIVVHSTTKYLNGHSDVVGGAIVSSSKELAEKVHSLANALGTTESPFDSWLVLRGIKTLGVRMREHERNAMRIAEFLSTHPNVERVYYPGLPAHPGHELARKQQHGFGGIVSFEMKGGRELVNGLLRSLRVFTLAESLGGVESLIDHPATMTHASMGPARRAEAGISDQLIRLSVGIEDVEDLIADLAQAFEAGAVPARDGGGGAAHG